MRFGQIFIKTKKNVGWINSKGFLCIYVVLMLIVSSQFFNYNASITQLNNKGCTQNCIMNILEPDLNNINVIKNKNPLRKQDPKLKL